MRRSVNCTVCSVLHSRLCSTCNSVEQLLYHTRIRTTNTSSHCRAYLECGGIIYSGDIASRKRCIEIQPIPITLVPTITLDFIILYLISYHRNLSLLASFSRNRPIKLYVTTHQCPKEISQGKHVFVLLKLHHSCQALEKLATRLHHVCPMGKPNFYVTVAPWTPFIVKTPLRN